MNLGATIRACRKKRQLTQAELASIAEISVSHLCLLEKNKRDPSLSTVQAISKALRIPLSVLVLLAANNDEVEEIDEHKLEELSKHIFGLMDGATRQESLF